MKLSELLASLKDIVQLPEHPAMDAEINGLTTNSHDTNPGDVFIGMPGTRVDGGEFWESAISKGAIAAVISQQAAEKIPPHEGGGAEGGGLHNRGF
jgi:UDP-N-acetylmuramoyl-L-alanyl-D-glutamate--2,6-diaminopimelate ligase